MISYRTMAQSGILCFPSPVSGNEPSNNSGGIYRKLNQRPLYSGIQTQHWYPFKLGLTTILSFVTSIFIFFWVSRVRFANFFSLLCCLSNFDALKTSREGLWNFYVETKFCPKSSCIWNTQILGVGSNTDWIVDSGKTIFISVFIFQIQTQIRY